jgi:hypothetical protein
MSATYFRPAATVQQEFAAAATSDLTPQHSCIIGPMVKVFDPDDLEDRAIINFGAYDPDADTDYSYRSLPAGARVKLDTVALRFEDLLAKFATLSGSNVIERGSQANYINIPSGAGFKAYTNDAGTSYLRNSVFKQRDVKIGDRVKVVSGSTTLKSRITGFINDVVAASVAAPVATANPDTQAYSGSAANTEVEGTDHLASIDVATTSYIGNIAKGELDDIYVLECITAGSPGTKQVETATVLGTIGASGAGNATVIVTSAILTGSPLTTSVAVANDDTAAQVAGKIRTALNLVSAITTKYTVGGSSATVTLTAKAAAANDTTLNISVANGTCTGLTTAATSANTTAGVAGVAVFKVTSDNGDNVLSVPSVGFDSPFDVGTRGLRASIASSGSAAFIVGEQFTFTVVAAYTQGAPTLMSGSTTYTGAYATTYKIEVVKGGTWAESPQVVVTTTTGIDSSGPTVVDFDTTFSVGRYGLTVKFASEFAATQDGLVLGDIYTIAVTAATKGAVRTAVLANPIDATITSGTDLVVDFYIYKQSMDIPARGYPEFSSETIVAGADEFTVSGNIVIQDSSWLENDNVTLGDLEVKEATVIVSYQALLTAEAGILRSLSDLSSVSAIMGKVTSSNPLGLGVQKALENSGGQPVYFISIASDDLEGYQDALEALESDSRPYFRVVLTHDEAIQDLLASHVTAESSEEKSNHFCVGMVSSLIPSVVTKYGAKTNGDNWTGYVAVEPGSSPAIYTRVNIAGADFIEDSIRPGDEVRTNFGADAFGNATYDSALVDLVIDAENLILAGSGFAAAVGASDDLQQIQVVRLLTRDEQADLAMAKPEAFSNRRVVNVLCDMPLDVPGYFMAAAVAGLASSVAPHQPITNYTVAGFNDQTGAYRRYTPTQQDRIASGGTLIVTQSVVEGQVYIRHQITTDRTDDRRAELSITRNIDSVSAQLLDGIKDFVGKYNISDHFVQILDVSMRSRLNRLAAVKVTESAGAQLNSWDEKSLLIEQNPVSRTEVTIGVDADFPTPGNRLKLKLRVLG